MIIRITLATVDLCSLVTAVRCLSLITWLLQYFIVCLPFYCIYYVIK